ncbi:hypothetical protein MRX96_012263 [Rhipicephalus microplus]
MPPGEQSSALDSMHGARWESTEFAHLAKAPRQRTREAILRQCQCTRIPRGADTGARALAVTTRRLPSPKQQQPPPTHAHRRPGRAEPTGSSVAVAPHTVDQSRRKQQQQRQRSTARQKPYTTGAATVRHLSQPRAGGGRRWDAFSRRQSSEAKKSPRQYGNKLP